MRTLGLLSLWALCAALALLGGWRVMYRLTYALGLLLLLAWLWARLGLLGLGVSRRTRATRVQAGETIDDEIIIENRGVLPRCWVEVWDGGTVGSERLAEVVGLGPRSRRSWRRRLHCARRGRYRLGPIILASGDPFGLFRCYRRVDKGGTLLVLPATVELDRFSLVVGELPGGALRGQRAPSTTLNAIGVRQYLPGDPVTRIHWPSTARLGYPLVREFELDPVADAWLVLDLEAGAHVGEGTESTLEAAVTVVASLGRHLLGRGRAVGLLAPGLRLAPERGERQLWRLLESLAVVDLVPNAPLQALLLGEPGAFRRRVAVIVVTARTGVDWVEAVRQLERRGACPYVVLLEAGTFAPAPSSVDVVAELAAARLPCGLVRRGDNLALALSGARASGGEARG